MKNRSARCHQNLDGFTLLEMSIVVGIIGLLLGGLILGQNLVKTAEIRSALKQMEQYQNAVNNFQAKYNGLPGDLANANQLNFNQRSGAVGHGDGDGLLDSCAKNTSPFSFACEPFYFWRDLTDARLLNEGFLSTGCTSGSVPASCDGVALTPTTQKNYLPPLARLHNNYVTVVEDPSIGGNAFVIAGITSTNAATFAYNVTPQLTINQAYLMDLKMDDGLPTKGDVFFSNGDGSGGLLTQTINATSCVAYIARDYYDYATGTGVFTHTMIPAYNVSSDLADTALCNLVIKMRK